MAERRANERVTPDPDQPIRVQIVGEGFMDEVLARDIGIGGLSVTVSHGFEGCNIGAPVELVVTMGRARPFLAHGRIRHHSLLGEGPHFGVEFTRIRPEDRQRIARYVAMRLALGAVAS